MKVGAWVSLDAPISPRWLAIRDERVASPIVRLTPKYVHALALSLISYLPDDKDHWQKPRETIARKAGDCEDIAILERAMLIAAGFDPRDLWVLVGNDLVAREVHAVLVVESFYLDCRTPKVLRLSRLTEFQPIAAYGETQLTFGKPVRVRSQTKLEGE